MATTKADNPRSIRRRRRLLRLCVWLLVALWLGRFAYVRITTPPAAQARAAGPAASASEPFESILKLPPVPTVNRRSSNWPWFYDDNVLALGLQGEWSPDPNSNQARAIAYVTKPSTGQTLDRIVAISIQRSTTSETAFLPTPTPDQLSQSRGDEYPSAISALAFRARHRVAKKDKLVGAVADLRAASDIAFSAPARWGPFADPRLAVAATYQLGCLVQEVDLPPELAREMIGFLRDELTLSVAEAALRLARGDDQVDRLLDRYYTDDGEGDGRLVLSAASDQLRYFGFGRPRGRRSNLWNVFSPLFNGRATVRAKLLGLTEDLRQLDGLDYDAASSFLSSRTQSGRGASVLDGPLIYRTQGVQEYEFKGVFSNVALRRALVVMLGLSAYKHDHDEYPDALGALTPEYLAEIPLDAPTGQQFHYEKVSGSAYKLGSVRGLPTGLYRNWWMPELGYQPDSYVPRRSPEQP